MANQSQYFKPVCVNTVSGTVTYDDIRVIPVNSEKTLQFQIKNVVFTDSFHFLAVSLDTLVSTLKRAGKQKFVQTTKYLGDDDLVFEKGHFPYAYFDILKRLDETTLPPKSAFTTISQKATFPDLLLLTLLA